MNTIENSVEGTNELLEALRVPLLERKQQDPEFVQHSEPPADTRYAIKCMQNISPADILPVLMHLFPGANGSEVAELG
jgi:hypothetical protein